MEPEPSYSHPRDYQGARRGAIHFRSDPNSFLNEKYVKNDLFSGSEEAQIHILRKIDVDSFSVNRWVRLLAFTQPTQTQAPLPEIPSRLVLDIDINSTQEKPIHVKENVAKDFFTISNQLIADILKEQSKV